MITKRNSRNLLATQMVTADAIGASPEQVKAITPKPESETVAGKLRSALFGAFDDANGDAVAVDVAKGAVKTAEDKSLGTREKIFVRMAKVSAELGLTADMLTPKLMSEALAAWAKARNDAGKNEATGATMSQFASELRRAMHPAARDHVKSAITDSRVEWEAERKAAANAKAADDKSFVPVLQNAFGKRHHMFASSKGTLQAHIDRDAKNAKGQALGSLTDLSDFAAIAEAQGNAQRTNAKSAMGKLAKLASQLAEIHCEFPDRRIAAMLEDFEEITETALMRARQKAGLSVSAPKAASKPDATTTTTARMTKAQKRAAREAAAAANASDDGDDDLEGLLDE